MESNSPRKSSKKSKKKKKSKSKSRSRSKSSRRATLNPITIPSERRMSVKPKTLSYIHVKESGPAACCFESLGCKFKGTDYTVKDHLHSELESHVKMLMSEVNQIKALKATVFPEIQAVISDFESVDRRYNTLDSKYGSHLLWKITNYQAEFKFAKEGTKTILFSPPFTVSKNGYRMMSSVALYGDGTARGHYMSVFVAILKSDHDSLLHWPFMHKITITLIDQNIDVDQRHDNTFAILPNPVKNNEIFLGRPTQERNPSLGTQKFIPLSVLNQIEYIKDDTIFIKIQVDDEHMNYL